MTRNLMVLAITAAISMSAFWAVAAQAADPELHCTSTTNTCTITGSERNTHTFNLEGGNIRCRTALQATLNARTVSSVSGMTAEYSGCRAFGSPITVRMEGCTYTLTNVAASNPATANVNIVCPAGKSIVWNIPSLPCTITYPAQNNLAHIVLNNSGGAEPTDVVANFTVSGITYIQSGAGCFRSGTNNTGTWNGETTFQGFNDNGAGQAEGNKVGLHVKPL